MHIFLCSSEAPNKWYLILLDHTIGVLWFFPRHTNCAWVQNFPLHIQHHTGNCNNIYITFKSVRTHISLQLTYKPISTTIYSKLGCSNLQFTSILRYHNFITTVSNDLTVPSAMASKVHFLPHHFHFINHTDVHQLDTTQPIHFSTINNNLTFSSVTEKIHSFKT